MTRFDGLVSEHLAFEPEGGNNAHLFANMNKENTSEPNVCSDCWLHGLTADHINMMKWGN